MTLSIDLPAYSDLAVKVGERLYLHVLLKQRQFLRGSYTRYAIRHALCIFMLCLSAYNTHLHILLYYNVIVILHEPRSEFNEKLHATRDSASVLSLSSVWHSEARASWDMMTPYISSEEVSVPSSGSEKSARRWPRDL